MSATPCAHHIVMQWFRASHDYPGVHHVAHALELVSLLARKRVVVIFDSLSQRSEATRRNVARSKVGTRIYRFSIDPVPEYLAALRLVDRFGTDALAWSNWLYQLAALPERGAAKDLASALANVVLAYEAKLRISLARGRRAKAAPYVVEPLIESLSA